MMLYTDVDFFLILYNNYDIVCKFSYFILPLLAKIHQMFISWLCPGQGIPTVKSWKIVPEADCRERPRRASHLNK